jgi:septum formation protein
MWINQSPLILASASTTRQNMLRRAGITFDVILPNIDERALKKTLPSENLALSLAKAKALGVPRTPSTSLVIGSDQTLWCNGKYYSKATSLSEAADHLRALSGQRHRLQSAVAIAENSGIIWSYVEDCYLTMRQLTEGEIKAYLELAGTDVLGSVGCYQVENLGINLFEKIEGDHFSILGMPLLPLLGFLRT